MRKAMVGPPSSNLLNKELVINAILLSLLLTVFLSGAIAYSHKPTSSMELDSFIIFMILAPVLYVLNLAISLLHYGLGRAIPSLVLRLSFFNGIGATAIIAAWMSTGEKVWLVVGISFLVFSLTSVLLRLRRQSIS